MAKKVDWRIRKSTVFTTYDISRKLRDEGKSSDDFEVMVGNLSLEELIGLKLHLSSKTIGGKFYGFPLWTSMVDVTRDALLKYAWSCGRTRREAGMFLGIMGWKMKSILWKYSVDEYFENLRKKNLTNKNKSVKIKKDKNTGD